MKIFITGDTHGEVSHGRLSSRNFKIGKTLTKEDLVIICGDFGFIFYNTQTKNEKYWLSWFDEKPWTTLFCDGNHENFSKLSLLPKEERYGGLVGKVSDSIYHLLRGNIYHLNGKKFFVMGGAASIDKHLRTENVTWWRQEIPSYKEMENGLINLENNQYSVDYIISHTAPQYAVRLFNDNVCKDPYISEKFLDPTSSYLQEVHNLTEYKQWYCGHFHREFCCNIGKGNILFLYKSIIQIL